MLTLGFFIDLKTVGPFSIGDAALSMQAQNAEEISSYFLSKYMVAFQVAGFLILAAVTGVVLLGKHLTPTEEDDAL